MAPHQRRTASHSQRPLINSNSNIDSQIYSTLPFFGFINMTISCGTTIYRAYTNGRISMVAFVTFVYFATFLLDYLFGLYHKLPPFEKSPRKHKLKIAIWLLLSAIMFGFCSEFSTCMSLAASLSFFGVVIAGNSFLFYVFFIWDAHKGCSICSSREGNRRNGKTRGKKYRQLTLIVENV